MIAQIYRLYSPKQIRLDFINESIDENKVLVKPTYLSICAADQRYYQGKRSPEILKKRLPMSLIHEAVGEVIYDPLGIYKSGSKVVLIPNIPKEIDPIIKENYLRSSKFCSSNCDGFMRNVINIERDRILPYSSLDDKVAVLSELLSVAMNALEHFEKYSHIKKQTIGVWGDGSVGFVMALSLKKAFPNAKLIVFGTNEEKLSLFKFADETILTNLVDENVKVDHAFECVGGSNAEYAINQILDIINPEGSIALLGVSEQKVPINTRMILEKGITILGNSRSGVDDFKRALELIQNDNKVCEYLSSIISDELIVSSIPDITNAFEKDTANNFKTIMKWQI